MTRKSREFELLVARIESLLLPMGAIVKSPDYCIDKVTGSTREVDASIRYQIGSTPVLITIECRDHADVQDDTWIEQIITKREKIGATQTIAVSSTGFSKPARASAEKYGIELRTVSEIDKSIIQQWMKDVSILVHAIDWEPKVFLGDFDVSVLDDSDHDLFFQQVKNDLGNALFHNTSSDTRLTIRGLLDAIPDFVTHLTRGVPRDGQEHFRTVDAHFTERNFVVPYGTQRVVLRKIRVHVSVKVKTVSTSTSATCVEYSDGKGATYQIGDWRSEEFDGITTGTSLQRDPETGHITILCTATDKNGFRPIKIREPQPIVEPGKISEML